MSGVKHCHANKAPAHIAHYTWASHGKQAISDSGDITPTNTKTTWSPAHDGWLEFDKFLYESLLISFPCCLPPSDGSMSPFSHAGACLSPLPDHQFTIPPLTTGDHPCRCLCFLLSPVTGHCYPEHSSHPDINPSQGGGTGFHQLMDGADNNILSNKHKLIQLSSY